jgi:hypothetical protein
MALTEAEQTSPTRRWSRGDKHAQTIKIGWRAKRLAGTYIRPAILRLAKAMDNPDDRVAVPACVALLDRALGKPGNAPEDVAAMAGAVLQVLTGIVRSPGMPALEQPMTDITPHEPATEQVRAVSEAAPADADDMPSC